MNPLEWVGTHPISLSLQLSLYYTQRTLGEADCKAIWALCRHLAHDGIDDLRTRGERKFRPLPVCWNGRPWRRLSARKRTWSKAWMARSSDLPTPLIVATAFSFADIRGECEDQGEADSHNRPI